MTTNRTYRWPGLRRILPDMLAFTIGLGIAWILGWNTTDLVWSLWLGSLVLGYLTILSTIGAGVYIGINIITHKDSQNEHRLTAILIGSGIALFLLGFFSMHFCGFHAGHALFLSSFFPIKGLPENAFFDAPRSPILLWKIVFKNLLPIYGVFLIPTIIAERRYVFASFIQAVKAVREKMSEPKVQDFKLSSNGQKKTIMDFLYQPYVNVIRMHALIFFFAFCHIVKIDSFFIYTVVYFVYFFPWKAFTSKTS